MLEQALPKGEVLASSAKSRVSSEEARNFRRLGLTGCFSSRLKKGERLTVQNDQMCQTGADVSRGRSLELPRMVLCGK